MSDLIFMDTETTGLSLDDDIWEFAAIRRREDGSQAELQFFIEHDRGKCAKLPARFRDEHDARYADHRAVSRREACHLIYELFDGPVKPHVVGAVPSFDTERITRMIQKEWPMWPPPNWHHHLIDVEPLVYGYLWGQHKAHPDTDDRALSVTLPWVSDELSELVGVTPLADGEGRHTAMGDARWVMALYDAVTGKETS